MNTNPHPTPSEYAAARAIREAAGPPALPDNWTATVLLSPFGDALKIMPHHDQLIVAQIDYSYGGDNEIMQVGVYLLESLLFFKFAFINTAAGGVWYWLNAAPGGAHSSAAGPFKTPLVVPSPSFLADRGATYGASWPLAGVPTDGWVIPTPPQPNIDAHGTWFSMRADNGYLWRVLNLDSNNPLNIPFLGACYFANIASFAPQSAGHLDALAKSLRATANPKSPLPPSLMVTQRDLQTAFADPIFSSPCVLADIQSVLPGINPPPGPLMPPPQWTDKVHIQGWTIGTDFIPYQTEVWYWWSYRHQRSMFIGLSDSPGKSTYQNRQDTVLYNGYTTIPNYLWEPSGWVKSSCDNCIPGVGIPRPDFVSADGGVIKGVITGNAAFGLGPDQLLMLIGVSMDRGVNSSGQAVLSLFWFWFTDDQKGVFFSEGNYVDTVVAHNLQTIDYSLFTRNADSEVNQQSFPDPCFVPNCAAPPRSLAGRPAPVFQHPSTKKIVA
jgi:hypothetical protein